MYLDKKLAERTESLKPCKKNESEISLKKLAVRNTEQWRIQDLSEGQAQSQDSSVKTTSDVIAKRSFEGEALAFLGGSGGMLPRKILKSRCSDMRFQPFLEYF